MLSFLILVKKNGAEHIHEQKQMWYQDRYQLAPAVTKNAPEKNLKISFQLILITKA
jgi:hypothetical protein